MKNKTRSKPNITRHDNGWQVRVQHKGKVRGSFFSDSKHGEEKALCLAKLQRDSLLKMRAQREDFGKRNCTKRFYYPDGIGENATTGVVGVYRTMKKMRSGERYPYYEMTVHEEKGNVITRARSIRKHGELGAFLQMAKARGQKLQKIYNGRFNEQKFMNSVLRYIQVLLLTQVTLDL